MGMGETGNRRDQFTIGEFSKVVGMSVKTLRFYHEEGLLTPSWIDPQSGYRYYGAEKIERARGIRLLRELEFSVAEIRELLRGGQEDERLVEAMERHRAELEGRIKRYRKVVRSLDDFIDQTKGAQAMSETTYQVEEKTLPAMTIAGVRMRGKYSDCGKGFGKIGRAMGRHIAGPSMLLHYDQEYKEEDADFEAAFPVKSGKAADGIEVRELAGGKCVSLKHLGRYETLGKSYERVFKYIKEKGYSAATPTREVYLKGPGMIFKGNPDKYLTEIQVVVE